MDKINNVLNKQYSFSGTHLLLGSLLIFSLIVLFSCIGGRHGDYNMMRNHDMRGGNQRMMQHYDRQGHNGQQRQDISPDGRQGMMRGKSNNQSIDNQGQPEPMMNSAASAEQPTPPSISTDTAN